MNTSGLEELRQKASQMEKDIKKSLNFQMGKLSEALKQATVVKEKRAKILRKPCNMKLLSDGTINIEFDNIEDGKKLFD